MDEDDVNHHHFLRNIIDSVADPIFVKDEEHCWVELNRAFCELIGHSREKLMGKSDYEFFPKEEADVFWTMDNEVFRTQQDNINEETFTNHQGDTRTISTKKSVFVEADGRKFLVGVIRDMTELHEAERRNLEMSQRLATSAKFAALGEMAGGIAHEINTPLAIIQGLADELLDVVEDSEAELPELIRINDSITKTVARVSRIITGLRTFARDSRKDDPVTVAASALIVETLALCGENLKRRAITLQVRDHRDDVFVRCRPTQIVQILLNLLNNARDAVKGTEAPTIELQTVVGDDQVELRVIDSGSGVPVELRERIMEPFFTSKPVGSGTGIGLSIAKSLAEDNGGTLSLDIDSPQTCFVVRLTRAPAPEAI